MTRFNILIFLLFSASMQAQDGINFFQCSFDEALKTAKDEHKIIFMDAYAEWCGPCKRMAKEVFTLKEVGDFFNKHFINVKMDMEKGEGPKLAAKYKVTAYPTLYFIDDAGEIVNVKVGGVNSEQLLGLGKVALTKGDKSKDYALEYEKGNRDPEMLKAYAYALMVAGQPTLKIANEYIKTQGKSDSDAFLEFIFDFASEADCSVFDKLVQHRDKLIKIKGAEVFKKKVLKACDATIDKAVEFQTPDLLNEAKKQMKLALPSFAAEYNMLADIRYHQKNNNLAKAGATIEKYVSKYAKGDAEKLNFYAQVYNLHMKDKNALLKAEKWAQEAYTKKKTYKNGRTYVDLMRKNGKESEAKKVEEELKTLPKD